jgi:hypothetical protein
MSYELRATSFEIQVTSYELKSVTCQILPAPANDCTVQDLDRSMIVQCKIAPYIDRIRLSRLICAGWWLYCTGLVPSDHQPVWARFLRSLYGGRPLQDFVNSAIKFNSIVVKTLKPVLCSSCDSVPLKFKKQTWRQYNSSMPIVWDWFRPLLNLAGQSL